MEQYSIREIIEQAIQTEKLGCSFYHSMADKFQDNERLKQFFNVLAEQEVEHEKRFAELKDAMGDEMLDNWAEASKYFRAIVESEFFLGTERALRDMEKSSTIAEAVRHAIGFEKETLLYYHGLKDILADRTILNEIIKEEKTHIMRLNDFAKSIS